MYLIVMALARAWWVGSGEHRFWLVLTVTAAFAALGYLVHGVTRSGAVAGAGVCFFLFAAAGPAAFVSLLVLFGLTWASTRIGRTRKERLGTAERGAGRSASQVLANLGIASACAIAYGILGNAGWLLAMTSALAEAAADTVSSELGQAFRDRALLITTFETVPAGTDGGITLIGTATGALAAFLVAGTALSFNLISTRALGISVGGALLGMLTDSYLGAGLERRGMVNNDTVNFLGTMMAAAFSLLLARILR